MTQVSTVTGMAIEMLVDRDRAGKEKYGVSMDRTDLKPGQWLQHSIEEHADALQYQIKLKMELEAMLVAAFDAGLESCFGHEHRSKEETERIYAEDLANCLKELLG